MYYKKELNLQNFDFWSGAKNHEFCNTELIELEGAIEELLQDSIPTETQINDLFWFEEPLLCDLIGIDYEEDYLNR